MSEQMDFPETFEKFAKEYGFKDNKEIYTHGSYLIPIFRVKQWLEHDNKLRSIETDTAYECGKHATKWIPVSERLPEGMGTYLVTLEYKEHGECVTALWYHGNGIGWDLRVADVVVAWMPLPTPYREKRACGNCQHFSGEHACCKCGKFVGWERANKETNCLKWEGENDNT